MVGVAKRPKAPDCGSGIRGFESHLPPHEKALAKASAFSTKFALTGKFNFTFCVSRKFHFDKVEISP